MVYSCLSGEKVPCGTDMICSPMLKKKKPFMQLQTNELDVKEPKNPSP